MPLQSRRLLQRCLPKEGLAGPQAELLSQWCRNSEKVIYDCPFSKTDGCLLFNNNKALEGQQVREEIQQDMIPR